MAETTEIQKHEVQALQPERIESGLTYRPNVDIIEKENALEIKRANLAAEENQARERANVAGQIAKVEEETKLQAERAALATKQQEADVITPARAKRESRILAAEGDAARILENGKATAEAIEQLQAQWQDGATRDLFLIQLLPELTDKVTSVLADNLRIDRLTILDGGDGEGLPNFVKNLTNSSVSMLEQLKNATGIDLADLAKRGEAGGNPGIPKDLT